LKAVLVLGGGGAKAIAHLGVWKAVVGVGAEVVEVVGTSMGAVMGAALAQGTSPDELLEKARSLGPKDVASIDRLALLKGVFAANILKPDALRRTIARLAPATSFDQLRIPLTVTATDVDSGELVLYGRRGAPAPLHEVLYASCALPLYFPPAVIDGRRLMDGGFRAVLPLAVAARIPADVVIAVHVGSGFDDAPAPRSGASQRPPPALLRAHDSAIRILMAAQTEHAIEAWPKDAPRLVVIRPVAERGATFAVGQSERYFAAGYEATKQRLPA